MSPRDRPAFRRDEDGAAAVELGPTRRRRHVARHWLAFRRDEDGAAAVEFGLVGSVFIVLVMGAIDFGFALFQYNQASKAVQLGARLAAVSDPVSSDLATFDGTSAGAQPGGPMPFYQRSCSGATQQCTNGRFDAAALRSIVFGRGNTACPAVKGNYPGMCQIFSRVQPQNVAIDYVHTGLGVAGIPGMRPRPTITVSLVNLNYQFIILGPLLNLPNIPMAGLRATATGEDLSGS